MHRTSWKQQTALWTYCLLAFAIPFPYRFGALGVILVLAGFLVTVSRDQLRLLKSRPAVWLWIAFYLLHAASWFWSTDKAEASFDLESKLSFLALPVALGASRVDHRRLGVVLAAFVWGVAAVSVYCLIHAAMRYSADGNINYFFYHDLVDGLEANAVYSAWYAFFALSVLLLTSRRDLFLKWSWVRWVLILLLLTYFCLLSSRTLFTLFFLLPVPMYISRQWRKRRFQGLRLPIACLLAIAIPVFVFLTDNPLHKRFTDVGNSKIKDAFMPRYQGEELRFSNLTTRVFFWRVGLENMQRNKLWLTGTGAGDVHTVQNEGMQALGIPDMEPEKPVHGPFYNANLHNMAFQSLVMLGVPGLLLYLLISFQPAIVALRHAAKNQLWLIFAVAGALFMFQEAALQTQAGIIFYCFFSMLFWHCWYSKKASGR